MRCFLPEVVMHAFRHHTKKGQEMHYRETIMQQLAELSDCFNALGKVAFAFTKLAVKTRWIYAHDTSFLQSVNSFCNGFVESPDVP